MGDMSQIIVPKSDQINSDDPALNGGKSLTITITDVTIKGGQEQPISIHFQGSDKVFRPCKSMCRVMAQAWGLDSKLYIGRSMTLYCDPTVKFGPLAVGGIRISHMSHIDGPMVMALTATKGVKKSFKVQPLVMDQRQSSATTLDRETAEQDLRDAATLDELKVAWTRKAMAPHREALAWLLEERKAAFAFDDTAGEGPATEQRGELFTATPTDEATAADIIAKIGRERVSDALEALMKRERDRIDALPDELQETVRAAYYARCDALRPAEEK